MAMYVRAVKIAEDDASVTYRWGKHYEAEDGTLTETVSHAYLRAIARAFRPGAVRIGKSVYGRDVEAAACRNVDGSIAVVLLNRAEEDISINLRMAGKIVRDVELPAGTLTTVEIG